MKPIVYAWRDAIADETRLSTTQKAIAWRLADYADQNGRNAHPGTLRLAQDVGLKVNDGDTQNKAVRKALGVLEDLGWVAKAPHPANRRLNVYRLTFPTGVQETPYSASEQGSPESPIEDEQGSGESAIGVRGVPKQGAVETPYQPSTNPTTNPTKGGDVIPMQFTTRANAAKVICPNCQAGKGKDCTEGRNPRAKFHLERHAAAIAAGAPVLNMDAKNGSAVRDAYTDHWANGGGFEAQA